MAEHGPFNSEMAEHAEGEILGFVVVTFNQASGQPDIDAPGLDDWDTACLERDDRRAKTMTTEAQAPYRCPTPCDEDCEIQGWGCHERHAYDKDHDPEACEALTLAGSLAWLLAAGLKVRVAPCGGAGRCCGDTGGRFSVLAAKPDPAADLSVPGGVESHGHASPGEALGFARDWCARNGITP